MRQLSQSDIDKLVGLVGSHSIEWALSQSIGGAAIDSQIWRFFSSDYPAGGGNKWNLDAEWKRAWNIEPKAFYAFGEDIFGNQLVIVPGKTEAGIWDHETGEIFGLLLGPTELVECCFQNGIGWIDFYPDGVLEIARKRSVDVPEDCHLHWTVPLFLGGSLTTENTTVVNRDLHLVGHARLYRQIEPSDRGTIIIAKQPPKENHD